MKFDRKTFFDGVKERLDPTLNQVQVEGFEFLLGQFEAEPLWSDVRHTAYALATVWHETAYSMQPVEECYYLGSRSKVRAAQKKLRYFPYFGRGYVQLTWGKNYEKAGKKLGVDLVADPGLALDPVIAFKVMTFGMFEGWFTGVKLKNFIHDDKCDYVNARKIINGLDKAGVIAGYARSFEKILKSSAAVPAGGSPDPLTEKADGESEPTPAADNAISAAKPPTNENQGEPVTVTAVATSLWTKIVAGVTAITGLGINAGSLAEGWLSGLTFNTVLLIALGCVLIVLAVFYMKKRQEANDLKTELLIQAASSKEHNTVELLK